MITRFDDAVYLENDSFVDSDRDLKITRKNRKVVTTRKEHVCAMARVTDDEPHAIPVGERAVYYSAALEG